MKSILIRVVVLFQAISLLNPAGMVAEDVVGHAERMLKQAAQESRHWHSRQDSIQRDLHDIVFFLDQSVNAAEKSDHEARREYAGEALVLLQRGMTAGYFDETKAQPVVSFIRRLLEG
ncbi:hypothetical protein [Nitrospira moscoviensis]|uniref:Uncharacterized protein n=1 Tax=Nitrospira moscoviensis TaxID=42253 RepID=A0A0K2GJI2_NITMO|nr:hypothetical protein [Nitrospira moscoviensis]ALA61105.1 hypothetical protein NITMOv2_4736 [Nitrospira moscoviensis]